MQNEFYSRVAPEDETSSALQELQRYLIVDEPSDVLRVRLSEARVRHRVPISPEGDVWMGQLIWWCTLAETLGRSGAVLLRPMRGKRSLSTLLRDPGYESDGATMIGDVAVLLSSGNWGTPPCGALALMSNSDKDDAPTAYTVAISPVEDGFGALIWAQRGALDVLRIDRWLHGRWTLSNEDA